MKAFIFLQSEYCAMTSAAPTSPVTKWLKELRQVTHSECMLIMQSDSLSNDDDSVTYPASPPYKSIISQVKLDAQVISHEFCRVFKKVEKGDWSQVWVRASRIGQLISSFLLRLTHQQLLAQTNVQNTLSQTTFSLLNWLKNESVCSDPTLVCVLSKLANQFSTLVDIMLSTLIGQILEQQQFTSDISSLLASLTELSDLTWQGPHMCELICNNKFTITHLLKLAVSSDIMDIKVLSLQTLMPLSCVSSSPAIFHRLRVFPTLAQLLQKLGNDQSIAKEIGAILNQLTLSHSPKSLQSLSIDCMLFIKPFISICATTRLPDVFICLVMSLANLSYCFPPLSMDMLMAGLLPTFIPLLNSLLMSSVVAKRRFSTVLVNISSVPKCATNMCAGTLPIVKHFVLSCKPQHYSPEQRESCLFILLNCTTILFRLDPLTFTVDDKDFLMSQLQDLYFEMELEDDAKSLASACRKCLQWVSQSSNFLPRKPLGMHQELVSSWTSLASKEESFV